MIADLEMLVGSCGRTVDRSIRWAVAFCRKCSGHPCPPTCEIPTDSAFHDTFSQTPLDSTCLTVNAQRALESAVFSLAAQGSSVGLIQPLERQINELDIPALQPYRITASHALDNDKQSLARALFDLADCEIIVLNSVSFSEADREMAAKVTGKPVVLARRIIASAVRLLLYQSQPITLPGMSSEFTERVNRLTARERQVMSLVAEGLSNKAIARQLGISPKTVEIHRSNVMSKMEVASSAALIRMVIQAGHP